MGTLCSVKNSAKLPRSFFRVLTIIYCWKYSFIYRIHNLLKFLKFFRILSYFYKLLHDCPQFIFKKAPISIMIMFNSPPFIKNNLSTYSYKETHTLNATHRNHNLTLITHKRYNKRNCVVGLFCTLGKNEMVTSPWEFL